MKGLQKLICGFLAFVMVFTILPVPAYAEEVEPCAEEAHVWDEGVRTEATEDAPAFLTYTCTVCGATREEEMEVQTPPEEVLPCADDAHIWDEGVSSESVITYTCTVCGETKTEDILVEEPTFCADDAHVWDDGVSSETVITYTCMVCGATWEEPVEVEELYTLTDDQRNRILSRDDGEWLFPLPQECYANIMDWNGCRGGEVCMFCGEPHNDCQEPTHGNSPYGHWGLEISVSAGTEVYAPRDGVAYWADDTLILEHPAEDGYAYYSVFMELESIAVVSGAEVEQGEMVAYSTDKLLFAMFMAPAGMGKAFAENTEKELAKIENCGWLEDQVGTGMIANSPSPESDEPWGDYSAVVSMLKKHPGSIRYFFMPEGNATLEEIEPASDVVTLAEVASGTCGENLTWVLDDAGVLTISGIGNMQNFSRLIDPPNMTNTPWYEYRESIIAVVISNGVTGIGDYAFYGCDKMVNVIIPAGVTSIGNYAFWGCNISTIDLPDGVTSVGESAFSQCNNLSSILLPDTISSLGDFVFSDCGKLRNVVLPQELTKIGLRVFSGCSSLTGIEIPLKVTAIGDYAFFDCVGLTEVILPGFPGYFTRIGMEAFANCSSLTSITMPKSVKVIDSSAFDYCTSLQDIYYTGSEDDRNHIDINSWWNDDLVNATWHYNCPETNTGIITGFCGENLTWVLDTNGTLGISGTGEMYDYHPQIPAPWHSYSPNIANVVIDGGVVSVGAYAFSGLVITDINLPETVARIGTGAFEYCSKVSYIILPKHLKVIEYGTFSYCENLAGITIPLEISQIDKFAFDCCESLTNVFYSGEEESRAKISIASGNEKLINATWHYNSTGPVEVIASGTCGANVNWSLDANGLMTISGVGDMDYYLIQGVVQPTPWDRLKANIKSLLVTDGVTTVGGAAFMGCGNLSSVKLGSSITIICAGAFRYCNNLTCITIPDSVTSIDVEAFNGCTNLKSITLPKSVLKIREYAFYNCSGLSDVYYPGTEDDRVQIAIDMQNSCLTNATWHYNQAERGDGFDLTRDGYCFENRDRGFDYRNWLNLVGLAKYRIPLERYQEVFGPTYTKAIYKQQQKNEKAWNGNCAGMSITALMFYENRLRFADYVGGAAQFPSGEYAKLVKENMAGADDGKYYLQIDTDSELTKLIERYQIWYNKSVEAKNYKSTENQKYILQFDTWEAVFKNVINTNNELHKTLMLNVLWTQGRDNKGHALVIDSSREILDLGNGWYRIYLYDPNNPYYSSFNGKKPCVPYSTAENRYVEVNIENGSWHMTSSSNSSSSQVEIGADENGDSSNNSQIRFLDIDSVPSDFQTKATYLNGDSNVVIAYASDNFSIYDSDDSLLFQQTGGNVTYINASVVSKYENKIEIADEPDNDFTSGRLELPNGIYKVTIENGTVAFLQDGNYTGVMVESPVTISNVSPSGLNIYAEQQTMVNVVVEEVNSEAKFGAVDIDILIGNSNNSVELEDGRLTIDVQEDQNVNLGIITEDGERTEENISSSDIINRPIRPDSHIHNYGDWVDCGGENHSHVCSVCNETETEPHNVVIDDTVPPTCTTPGLTEGKHCSVCNAVLVEQTEVAATGHTPELQNTKEATCTEDGYTGDEVCSDCGIVVRKGEEIKALGHTYGDWTDCNDGENHSHVCSVCNKTEMEAHNVVIDDAVPPTSTDPGLTEGKHCSVCGAVLVAQTEIPPLKADFTLTLDNIGDADTVWVDGRAYPVQKNPDGGSYIALSSGEAKTAAVYSYNAAGAEAHKTYPTGMKVWTLDYQDGRYTATHVPEFENLLQYKGSSIRITGNKGIRMITGVPDGKRDQLIQDKLAGYTLEEYGTVLAIADQIENGSLTLGDAYAKSNYAYKRNTADAIFEHSGGLIQYTNVLVGFTMDQCDDDIAMRPYMKLSDKDGNVITLYGGIVYRSIGYIAWQNKDIFSKGSDGYNYIWDIINAVYGDNLPG